MELDGVICAWDKQALNDYVQSSELCRGYTSCCSRLRVEFFLHFWK